MEKFNEIGFLSEELVKWVGETRTEFSAEFDVADSINRLAMKMLFDLPSEEMTDAHALANLCFGRALQSFQSAILLAQRGALLDSRTLVRSCTESAIALSVLRIDETMPQQMHESYDRHRLGLANALLNRNGATGMLAEEEALVHRQVIDEIRKEYGTKGPRAINWESKARCGGTVDLYNLAYRLTSGDGVHTTMPSLERFFSQGTEGKPSGFKFHPDKSDIESTLFLACSAMLHVLGSVTDWFGLEAHHDELRACIGRWKQTTASTGDNP
jgi:hypothetical protein